MTAPAMKPMTFRRLTPGERGLAAEMFGHGLDASRVRLFAIPIWNRAFVAGPGLIVWPAAAARPDFAAADTPLPVQAVFVHELTHVWQAQHGVSLLRAKLKAGDGAAAYAYDLSAGPAFTDLNIEQQAMVVEHAFLASRGARTPHPAELYANARSNWRPDAGHG
ncbi:hypothetical protein ACO2Q0_07855 [Phenylobacterium sp. VNQ135]|uniref:hypothetical protein n=1 Tax=Phenylobacterium sp. VNQ135 TaxID=3400922 RepID=UPI003C0AD470